LWKSIEKYRVLDRNTQPIETIPVELKGNLGKRFYTRHYERESGSIEDKEYESPS